MNVYVGGYVFLTSVVVRGEWSASRPDRFNLTKRSHDKPMATRLGGLQNWYGQSGERTNLVCWDADPARVQPPDASKQ
jgi:hypothetical protein